MINHFKLGETAFKENKHTVAFLHFAEIADQNSFALIKLSEIVAKEGNLSHAIYLLKQAISQSYEKRSMDDKVREKLFQKIENYNQEFKDQQQLIMAQEILIRMINESQSETIKEIGNEVIKTAENEIKEEDKIKKEVAKKEKNEEKKARKVEKKKVIENLYKQGADAFQQKKYLDAFIFFQQIFDKNPQHLEAHRGTVACALALKSNNEVMKKAIISCDAEIQEYKNNSVDESNSLALIYCAKAKLLILLSENEKEACVKEAFQRDAQENFKAAIVIDPALNDARLSLGRSYLQQSVSRVDEVANKMLIVFGFQSRVSKGDNIEAEQKRVKLRILSMEQFLLVFANQMTEAEAAQVIKNLDFFRPFDEYINSSFFSNAAERLSTEELRNFKIGYIRWIECDLKNNRYEDGVIKYEFIEKDVTFSEWFTADFLANVGNAYAKNKMLNEALACYEQANVKQPHNAAIKTKLNQFSILAALRLNNTVSSNNGVYGQSGSSLTMYREVQVEIDDLARSFSCN
ncbi:MAG: hypothetical protein V4496_04970 [Pseudomonadota bacterium]